MTTMHDATMHDDDDHVHDHVARRTTHDFMIMTIDHVEDCDDANDDDDDDDAYDNFGLRQCGR